VVLGANPIYLLGIDGKHQGRRSHYHAGYPRQQVPKTAASFVHHFEYVAKSIRKAGIRVVNLNPQSAVRCFPFSTIDKVLGNDEKRNNEKEMEGSGIPGGTMRGDESGMVPATGTPEESA